MSARGDSQGASLFSEEPWAAVDAGMNAHRMGGSVCTVLSSLPRITWLLYATLPPAQQLPRRWSGLVNYGRLDIAARGLLAALYPTGRYNGSALLLHIDTGGGGEQATIIFNKQCLPETMHYEHESSQLLLNALRKNKCPVTHATLSRILICMKQHGYTRILLKEGAKPLHTLKKIWGREKILFIIGTREDPPIHAAHHADHVASIGCHAYLTTSVISYINLHIASIAGGGDEEG